MANIDLTCFKNNSDCCVENNCGEQGTRVEEETN